MRISFDFLIDSGMINNITGEGMYILKKLNRVIKSSTNSLMKCALKEEKTGPKIDRYEVEIPDFCKSEKSKRVVAEEGLRTALGNWKTGQSIKDFNLHFTGNLGIWILKK